MSSSSAVSSQKRKTEQAKSNGTEFKVDVALPSNPSKRVRGNNEAGAGKDYPLFSPAYTSEDLHRDVENGNVVGFYGGNNSGFLALGEAKSKIDLHAIQLVRSADEIYIPELNEYLKNPDTQRRWNELVCIDPWGMWSKRPTISATYAKMYIKEMEDLAKDGDIVEEDGGINCVKCAVDYVWNLPGISSRLEVDEDEIRMSLSKYTQNEKIYSQDPNRPKAYLPAIGGATIYFIGNILKLSDPNTEVAVRVHDECNGSDVFGTDICTCRPYLMFAIQGAVECAQRGGVGIIIYFRKEGRALGEVTKFRVYNARKMQKGGDRPEMYFKQTETIAGIRDARFQELMPDILLWLGIHRIDWLMSMSSEKYNAIDNAGIQVMQRISLPDELVPENASVEINAKISAGYHTDKISSNEIAEELRDLKSVRSRSNKLFELAKHDALKHFKLDMTQISAVAKRVVDCIKTYHPNLDIPYHSRIRHFTINGMDRLSPIRNSWPCDDLEKVRRVLDLVTVSVLLDAGAGKAWKYTDSEGTVTTRSEGLAMASLEMFKSGLFSSDEAVPHRVNSRGLKKLNIQQLCNGMQVSQVNPIIGLEGRLGLLHRLADALEANPEFFGYEICRPGNILDYVMRNVKDGHVSLKVLWKGIVEGLESVWPASLSGVRRGDVWVYTPLKEAGVAASDMIPFHKLSQWLVLSLLEPMEEAGIIFDDMKLLTALAEYRNGGLFVDAGVLTLRNPDNYALEHPVGSELVVEWRALTIALVDVVADLVRSELKMTAEQLSLPKILEGGTWRAGRIIAKEKRDDGSPPITIRSDGTVF